MFEPDINIVAVLVAAAINMALGAVWYSPGLFAKPWMKLTGIKEMQAEGATQGYVIAAIASLVAAYVLAHFVAYVGATTFTEGMAAGFWAWLGFTATAMASTYVFSNRPLKLWAIDSGYYLVGFVLMGGLLAVWY